MVVAYRLAALTAFVLRQLGVVKVAHFSQPNLLLGRGAVPEFFQSAVTPAALGAAVLAQLEDTPERRQLLLDFERVHRQLRAGGAQAAAQAIEGLLRAGVPDGPAPA
jgi:lipid-A-disaccharide synthase